MTFHHGKTPHMTPAEHDHAVAPHPDAALPRRGTQGEGDHYPWKVYVNQITGERFTPNALAANQELQRRN